MIWLLFQGRKVIRRIAKLIGVTLLYFNKMGLKSINAKITYDLTNTKKHELGAKELFLFIDGLNDIETTCGINIVDSPHFDLISRLASGKSIEDSEYVERARTGRLDMRDATFYDKSFYEKSFNRNMLELETKSLSPLIVFSMDDKYYLLDGKHRAALCAYKNLPVEAYIVNRLNDKDFILKVYKKLSKSQPKIFSKNIDILERALKVN